MEEEDFQEDFLDSFSEDENDDGMVLDLSDQEDLNESEGEEQSSDENDLRESEDSGQEGKSADDNTDGESADDDTDGESADDDGGRESEHDADEGQIITEPPSNSRVKGKRKGKEKPKQDNYGFINQTTFVPKLHDCQFVNCQFSSDMTKTFTPFQILKLFITREMTNEILEQTEKFVSQVKISETINNDNIEKNKKSGGKVNDAQNNNSATNNNKKNPKKRNRFKNWTKMNDRDFWQFIGLNLLMGITKKHSMKDYWSEKELLQTPIFGKTMSRDK